MLSSEEIALELLKLSRNPNNGNIANRYLDILKAIKLGEIDIRKAKELHEAKVYPEDSQDDN